MRRFNLICITLALILAPALFAKNSLKLGRGTMQLGGTIQLPISIPKNGGAIVGLDIAPSWDYFVTQSFSLGLSTSVQKTSITGQNTPWAFSVAARGIFYFNLGGPIYPYLGGGGGIRWKTGVREVEFPLTIPVGMLIAINSALAIDFGVPIEFTLSTDGYKGMLLPVGFIGVRGFF